MPTVDHYRKLAREYSLKAQRTPASEFVEGYRKLAEGYQSLADGLAALVKAHRSIEDKREDVPQYPSDAIGDARHAAE